MKLICNYLQICIIDCLFTAYALSKFEPIYPRSGQISSSDCL